MKYVRLADKLNCDEVVKHEARNVEYQYYFGDEKWIRSSIMLKYVWADNNQYGQFEEISEEQALALLDEQRERYNKLLELAIKAESRISITRRLLLIR